MTFQRFTAPDLAALEAGDAAELKFETALAVRRQLNDPLTASTERALAGLAGLRVQQP